MKREAHPKTQGRLFPKKGTWLLQDNWASAAEKNENSINRGGEGKSTRRDERELLESRHCK